MSQGRNDGLPSDSFFTVHNADARHLDAMLVGRSSVAEPLITTTVTSPPYWNLKDYGIDDQIGWGQAKEEYLADCRGIFDSLFRHSVSTGTLWIIADSLRISVAGRGSKLEPLPFELAEQAESVGWTLRDVVIWRKDRTLPWSGAGRLRNTFEYILLMVKHETFKYEVRRIRDPEELRQWWVRFPERYNPEGKAPTNVWDIPIPVQGSWKTPAVAHACPLPPDLVERLILLTSDPGDVVLDPFAGTGTVVAEARRLGRRGLGIELNPRYVEAFEKRVLPEIMKRDKHDAITKRAKQAAWLQETLLKLRVVKYAKVILSDLAKSATVAQPILAVVMADVRQWAPNQKLPIRVILVVHGEAEARDAVRLEAKRISDRAPASKFGLQPEFVVCLPEDLEKVSGRKRLVLYTRGQTWTADGWITIQRGLRLGAELANGQIQPILSNVRVNERPREIETAKTPTH